MLIKIINKNNIKLCPESIKKYFILNYFLRPESIVLK